MRLSSAFLSVIVRLLSWPARLWRALHSFQSRFWRAVRFKCYLNYSWRLAWCIAGRPA